MDEVLISFVIPVYNVGPYLSACVNSVLAQRVCNFECICVDDGSTDGSGELLDRFAERDPRVVVVHQKNSGVGAARNAGMRRARGEFVAFVDSDDVLEEDFLTHAMAAFAKYPDLDVWSGQLREVDENGEDICCVPPHVSVMNTIRPLHDFAHANGRYYLFTIYPKLFRKSLLDRDADCFLVGARRGEDSLFMTQVYSGARRVLVQDKCVYRHRIRPGSLIASSVEMILPDIMANIKAMVSFAKTKRREREMEEQIAFTSLGRLNAVFFIRERKDARNYIHALTSHPEFKSVIVGTALKYAPIKFKIPVFALMALPRWVTETMLNVAWFVVKRGRVAG